MTAVVVPMGHKLRDEKQTNNWKIQKMYQELRKKHKGYSSAYILVHLELCEKR